jgi:hypothetical protein
VGECQNLNEIDDLGFYSNKVCQQCGSELQVRYQQSAISDEVHRGCRVVLDQLKEELRVLIKYKIPPQFFGPAASLASKIFHYDKFQ